MLSKQYTNDTCNDNNNKVIYSSIAINRHTVRVYKGLLLSHTDHRYQLLSILSISVIINKITYIVYDRCNVWISTS